MRVEARYCDSCSVKIDPEDLSRGEAVEVDDDVFHCKECVAKLEAKTAGLAKEDPAPSSKTKRITPSRRLIARRLANGRLARSKPKVPIALTQSSDSTLTKSALEGERAAERAKKDDDRPRSEKAPTLPERKGAADLAEIEELKSRFAKSSEPTSASTPSSRPAILGDLARKQKDKGKDRKDRGKDKDGEQARKRKADEVEKDDASGPSADEPVDSSESTRSSGEDQAKDATATEGSSPAAEPAEKAADDRKPKAKAKDAPEEGSDDAPPPPPKRKTGIIRKADLAAKAPVEDAKPAKPQADSDSRKRAAPDAESEEELAKKKARDESESDEELAKKKAKDDAESEEELAKKKAKDESESRPESSEEELAKKAESESDESGDELAKKAAESGESEEEVAKKKKPKSDDEDSKKAARDEEAEKPARTDDAEDEDKKKAKSKDEPAPPKVKTKLLKKSDLAAKSDDDGKPAPRGKTTKIVRPVAAKESVPPRKSMGSYVVIGAVVVVLGAGGTWAALQPSQADLDKRRADEKARLVSALVDDAHRFTAAHANDLEAVQARWEGLRDGCEDASGAADSELGHLRQQFETEAQKAFKDVDDKVAGSGANLDAALAAVQGFPAKFLTAPASRAKFRALEDSILRRRAAVLEGNALIKEAEAAIASAEVENKSDVVYGLLAAYSEEHLSTEEGKQLASQLQDIVKRAVAKEIDERVKMNKEDKLKKQEKQRMDAIASMRKRIQDAKEKPSRQLGDDRFEWLVNSHERGSPDDGGEKHFRIKDGKLRIRNKGDDEVYFGKSKRDWSDFIIEFKIKVAKDTKAWFMGKVAGQAGKWSWDLLPICNVCNEKDDRPHYFKGIKEEEWTKVEYWCLNTQYFVVVNDGEPLAVRIQKNEGGATGGFGFLIHKGQVEIDGITARVVSRKTAYSDDGEGE